MKAYKLIASSNYAINVLSKMNAFPAGAFAIFFSVSATASPPISLSPFLSLSLSLSPRRHAWNAFPGGSHWVCAFSAAFSASIALGIGFEVPAEMRDHLEVLPRHGYVQANSTFSGWIKFKPRWAESDSVYFVWVWVHVVEILWSEEGSRLRPSVVNWS